jgi:cytidylate kinase
VAAPPSVPDVKCKVVCISHATGSGGPDIGRLVAQRLGFRYVDEDIVAHAAAKGGVDPADIADEERRKSFLARLVDELGASSTEAWATLGYLPSGAERGPASDELQALIRGAIDETAARGDAVIVSHAASHALSGRSGTLRVLVTASVPTRIARLRETDELEEPAATRAIRDADAARADYLKRFHGVDGEQPTQYDVVLNTDQLSLEEAADLVSAAASA